MKEPKLRFLADDGNSFPDLKGKRLNDVCEYNKGQSVGVNYVGTENMKQDFSGVNDLDSRNEVKGVAYNIGDTLMSNIRPYLKKTWKADVNGVCSTDVLVFHPTDINSDYLYHNISSEKFISYVMTGAKGTKMPRGDKEHIMNYDIQVPCLSEQQKIASLFSELDNLIQSAEKELEGYRELKHGMSQKMFPKKGEKVPEIRFPEFTGDWEQRKLGDIFKEYSEKHHEELPALTIIQGGGTILREKSDRNLQYDKSNLSGYKMVKKDDFIVHLRSFEGGLEKANSDGIISPAYHTLHGENVDPRFYYPYFRSYEFINKKLVAHVYGIRDGRSIDVDGMKTIKIPYTSYEEQKKIGDYLDALDNLIVLQQKELDGYKELKKGLLQQMFC